MMHCTFLSTTLFFPPLQETGEAGKIRSDLKKCNASWSIGRGRLARETLANKWRRISEQNAGVRPATSCEFCFEMRTCRMSKNAVLIFPTKWKKTTKNINTRIPHFGKAGTRWYVFTWRNRTRPRQNLGCSKLCATGAKVGTLAKLAL